MIAVTAGGSKASGPLLRSHQSSQEMKLRLFRGRERGRDVYFVVILFNDYHFADQYDKL